VTGEPEVTTGGVPTVPRAPRPPLGSPGLSWSGDGALGGVAAPPPVFRVTVAKGRAAGRRMDSIGLVVSPMHLRVGAFVVDQMLLSLVLGVVAVLMGVGPEGTFTQIQEQMQPIAPLLYAVEVLYRWPWNALGWSPGKRLLGLRVVNAQGVAPGMLRGLLRSLFTLGSELPFFAGQAWAFFDAERRTWHDHLAGTWVVRTPGDAPRREPLQ
jgi:uncharacterized RDD family membrane protein YckC